ncbi:hypothetical protein THTE_2548 [Thermogutta terrifontis]|uniref:Uncharacterized protein n=1 Tax=Thermogutta terrifontis TaxID=1331910 RepID=A0A286RGS0_9BACT|nr:hypothetical protein THTE_2548 [Thermogutta terrifontis]
MCQAVSPPLFPTATRQESTGYPGRRRPSQKYQNSFREPNTRPKIEALLLTATTFSRKKLPSQSGEK